MPRMKTRCAVKSAAEPLMTMLVLLLLAARRQVRKTMVRKRKPSVTPTELHVISFTGRISPF